MGDEEGLEPPTNDDKKSVSSSCRRASITPIISLSFI